MVYDHVLCVNADGDSLMPSDILPEGSENIFSIISPADIPKMDVFLKSDEKKSDGIFAVFSPNLRMKWAKIQCLKEDDNIYLGITDYTEKQQNRRKEQHTSKYDSLTNTHYRHQLDGVLSEMDKPENLPISFIMFDVNGVKLTNEAFGYSQGDMQTANCSV